MNQVSRTFQTVRTARNTNIPLTLGYQGAFEINNSYYFPVEMFGSPLIAGNKILLYAQTDLTQNGIWGVVSIVSGFVNITRPIDYIEGFLINPGEVVLVSEGSALSARISILEARLAALERKNL